MGQISSFPTPHKPLIDFACLPKEAIQSLWLSYNLLGEGWSVNLDQFCALFKGAAYLRDNYKYTDDQLRSLFKTFDTDANGLIDVLEMVITLALVSGMYEDTAFIALEFLNRFLQEWILLKRFNSPSVSMT